MPLILPSCSSLNQKNNKVKRHKLITTLPDRAIAMAYGKEILEDRHGLSSTVITRQFPVSAWHEIIGYSTIADAICDRMVSSSYRIELVGESLRKKFKRLRSSYYYLYFWI